MAVMIISHESAVIHYLALLIPTHSSATLSLLWRHNGRDGVSNYQPHYCLRNRLSRRRAKKISKLRVTGICAGNSPVTGEFPAQMANNAENVSIWWRHHVSWRWKSWPRSPAMTMVEVVLLRGHSCSYKWSVVCSMPLITTRWAFCNFFYLGPENEYCIYSIVRHGNKAWN